MASMMALSLYLISTGNYLTNVILILAAWGKILVTYLSVDYIIKRKYFNKILKELKIKQFNFHSLRHTFATNCISLGCDYKTVSELLGHSNVNITLNLYVHPRYSQKKKCIDLISKIFQEKVNM